MNTEDGRIMNPDVLTAFMGIEKLDMDQLTAPWKVTEELTLAAKNLEELQRTVQTKIGRNDPCPCGSGHKFKRCCATS